MAVKSSEQLKSCRPIRALLFRGAPKDVVDNKGNTPQDLAENLESHTLKEELIGYLSAKGGILDCCMLKTPLKKVEKSCKMPFLFFMLNFSVYVLLGLFLYPIWVKEELIEFDIGLGIASFFMWIFTAFTAPGFIVKPKNVDFLKLMQLIDPVQLCPDCEIVRTPRSRHCGTCN